MAAIKTAGEQQGNTFEFVNVSCDAFDFMQRQQGVLGILGCSLHKINLYKFAVHKYQVHVSGSVIFPTIERLFVFSEFC